MSGIHINFWDDFATDTYAYVEESNVSHEDCKRILEFIKSQITDIDCELFYYDSKIFYPTLIGIYTYERWQLMIKNITYEKLEDLVDKLKKNSLIFDDKPLIIYSGS